MICLRPETYKKLHNLSCFLLGIPAFCFPQAPRAIPADYGSSASVNYIRVWEAKAPQANAGTFSTKGLREVLQTTQYFDGLGRPLQAVIKQGSYPSGGNPVDMVNMVEYDAFGREVFKYLPTPANNTGGNTFIDDGKFKLNPFAQQAAFYNASSSTSPLYGQGETYYYGETRFEPSPLNRITEVSAAGNGWSGSMYNTAEASRRSVKTKYYVNTSTDAVRIWSVSTGSTGNWSSYSSSAAYAAGTLYKAITIDEQGKQVVEFKDKEGKVVLKKVQLTATDNGSGSGHTGWLCSYYIYDALNNLHCVIQPRGVELISSGWALTDATILAEQCFRYEYDQRNRMIMKQAPGAGQTDMIYDARDRLVMTQDAKLKATNQYLVTKYDALNRPIETGLWTSATSPQTHRTSAYSSTSYPTTSGTYEYLTRTGYDDYSAIPSASGLTGAIDNTNTTGTYGFYTTYNSSPAFAQQVAASAQTRGLVTWTEVKVLGTSAYTYAVNIYDDKGRLIQVKSKNLTGGADITTTQYNWAGQPLVVLQKQVKATTPAQTSIIVTRMTYDDLGRLAQTDKKIQHTNVNGNALPASYTTVSKNEYDALGQLKKKNPGNKPGAGAGTPLAKLEYQYNIRGWLLSINKGYMAAANADQYFAMELGYDKNASYGTFTPLYNGNIAGLLWKSEGDQEKRKYNFTYDAVSRLTGAAFTQYVSGSGSSATFNTSANKDFSVSNLSYDANGNILAMTQKGLKLNASSTIDQLTYTYNSNSNRLLKVVDAITADNKLGDFKDGSSGTGNDYSYDVNGNLTADNNKSVSSITYNHLNLPQVITVTGKGTIAYTYDAAGNKLKKTAAETSATVPYNGTNYTGSITTTTLYLGGMVYESKAYGNSTLNTALGYTEKLQFAPQEEGRIRALFTNASTPNTPTGFAYDYFIKDHLGNIRMVLTEEQKQDIYPAATLEGTYNAGGTTQTVSMINYEKQFYNIDNTKVVAETSIPSWPTETVANTKLYYNNNGNPPTNGNYPAGTTPVQTDGSTKLYKLNATTNKTGLEFVAKVMAGDKIDILGKSYYLNTTNVSNANSTPLDLLGLMTNMLLGPGNPAAGKGFTASLLNTTNTGLVPATFFRGNNGETGATVPKAYINYLLLDEQFKYVGGNFSRVGVSGTVKNHFGDASMQNISVTKNGYIFVYVSNESNLDVFFDNLQVIHTRGAILEETHYYPFGLTMAGISSKALNNAVENKYRFNGGNELQNKEFSDGSGLDWYDATHRMYDAQIGRFHQVDPLTDEGGQESLTPYQFSYNNPVRYNDPDGQCPNCLIGALIGAAVDYATQVAVNRLEGKSWSESLTQVDGTSILISAGAGALSSGASAFVPKSAAGKVVGEVITTTIDAGESVLKQYNEGSQQGKSFSESVSLSQTASDVVANKVAGKLTENVQVNSSSTIKSTERQLDRAERVAAGDPSSTGRAATVNKLENKLTTQNRVNQAANQAATGVVSATIQGTASAAQGSQQPPQLPKVNYNPTDNTSVRRPVIYPLR
jgi:RHS repeat-associated protein